ncbi:D-isomer specific 2-hydroxyacid dehydrogenase [Diplogelasinospora grovesii]|uniref:D-isomer specific 2-hydroxyacid dehydrogenase n=1 Tax=Diplogelasinospora grovesii TaxID=303347 RepID=A0AAN6N9B0_9PEZI|nr:D-isomer specific 2-hydroxyacid dehydrogenase [Diplogelasinospora grovesii]
MAEPTNTPMPPSTPVPASTPRSESPAPPATSLTPNGTTAVMPMRFPPPPEGEGGAKRPIVLHIGDPTKYNPETHAEFSEMFEVIRPSAAERERSEFIKALKERRWGDFTAIFRPFWGTGGEMGRWDAELVDLLPDTVRVFASAGAGFDWADTKLLGERGIIYCNSGLAAAEAVADFAVAMIISTFRHLPWCMGAATLPHLLSRQSSSSSSADDAPARKAFQLCHAQATAASHNPRGHVLGLIGFGNIGQQIAAKLGHAAFGMRIAYYDVIRKSPSMEMTLGATFYGTLEELMKASDCVVLCTPASSDGKPLITADSLGHMRKGTRFVNIARGSLVNEDDLVAALEEGRVGAAALDVHADEPRVNPKLIEMAGLDGGGCYNGLPGRVMLTCHNAGGTVETHIGFEELSMRNIMAVLQGKEAITPVNMHLLKAKE